MRRLAVLALFLASCTLATPGGTPEGVATEAIEVTPLDGAPTTSAPETAKPEATAAATPAAAPPETAEETPAETADTATAPAEDAADPAAAAVEEPPPAPVLSPAAQACVKRGGKWIGTGSGLMACVKPTRDAGKSCSRQTECQGYCLARSRTCAPYTPLFGCNDILQANGQRVTLCLD